MRRFRSTARAVTAAALAFAVVPDSAVAQAVDYRPRLDSLFEILESHQRTMGAVSIRKGDRVLYHRTFGHRDSTTIGWVRTDAQTMFRIGSVTKPFTAVMIYQLIDERRLSLETRLAEFFPQLPNSDAITIRDLLGHTSGLGDYSRGLDVYVALSRDSLLRRIASQPVQFAPGSARRYNNSNFALLGNIIEQVTASSYAAQLQRRIVDRISLRRTRVGGPVTPAANESRAYYYSDGHWEQQRDDAIENAGGAGALISTADDLTRFLAALFGGHLISPALLTEMTTGFNDSTRINGKGLGPFTIPGQGKSGYSHDGSIGAHTALVGYVPDDSLAVALTINGHNHPQNRIFFHVWGILYGSGEPLPSFTLQSLPASAVSALVGIYTADAYGLTITVRSSGSGLEAQATGQDPFPLAYVGRNRFVFEHAGILIEFADPVAGASPRFTLFQQKAAIPLVRVASSREPDVSAR
jgi:CubicO group peptidase (beta-lactamase class C family)